MGAAIWTADKPMNPKTVDLPEHPKRIYCKR